MAPPAGFEPASVQLCTYRLEGVANTGAHLKVYKCQRALNW